jgi:hypothetical protein
MINGAWKDNSGGDIYIINLSSKTLEYDDGGWDMGYKGNIKEIVYFNNKGTAGIIFIEYTKKPIDYGTGLPPGGNFIGIYFRNLTSKQGDFTTPSNYPTEPIPATSTLQEAKNKFTEDTMGTYTAFWSVCVKQ